MAEQHAMTDETKCARRGCDASFRGNHPGGWDVFSYAPDALCPEHAIEFYDAHRDVFSDEPPQIIIIRGADEDAKTDRAVQHLSAIKALADKLGLSPWALLEIEGALASGADIQTFWHLQDKYDIPYAEMRDLIRDIEAEGMGTRRIGGRFLQ